MKNQRPPRPARPNLDPSTTPIDISNATPLLNEIRLRRDKLKAQTDLHTSILDRVSEYDISTLINRVLRKYPIIPSPTPEELKLISIKPIGSSDKEIKIQFSLIRRIFDLERFCSLKQVSEFVPHSTYVEALCQTSENIKGIILTFQYTLIYYYDQDERKLLKQCNIIKTAVETCEFVPQQNNTIGELI